MPAGTKWCPLLKGTRCSALQQRLVDPATKWENVKIENWYDSSVREVEVYSETCLWGTLGKPSVPIRWVLVRDVQGEFEPWAFLSTELMHTPLQMCT